MIKRKVVTAYDEAAADARSRMREEGDSPELKRAVAEAERLAPEGPDKDFWSKVTDVLNEGKSVRTKEL